MRKITTRAELVELARELGVRDDWHEPDEQELGAFVEGTSFDNAMPAGHWLGSGDERHAELHVVLHKLVWDEQYSAWRHGRAIAVVNLAMLFAWATGFDESKVELHEDLERCQDETIRRVVRQYFSESDPQDQEYAFSIIEELTRELPRAPRALTWREEMLATERVSTLNKWASKFAKQHTEAPVGPQRIMAMALSDAFRQAAKHEQALQRHPAECVPEYGTHD